MFSEAKFYALSAGAISFSIETAFSIFRKAQKMKICLSQLAIFCISQEHFDFIQKLIV
jgi:hypothetical protein